MPYPIEEAVTMVKAFGDAMELANVYGFPQPLSPGPWAPLALFKLKEKKAELDALSSAHRDPADAHTAALGEAAEEIVQPIRSKQDLALASQILGASFRLEDESGTRRDLLAEAWQKKHPRPFKRRSRGGQR